jgi:hypothetical protein
VGSDGVNGWVWNYATCSWTIVCDPTDPSCGTPIVIDTAGTGFDLTSAKDGVVFDFFGTGKPIRISWTAPGSKNGWLALPEADGMIHSARDLFGNLTPQFLMKSHPPNGFSALAIYDGHAMGGNNNGMIDPGDAVWGRLRVWIDANHDGISQPEELHTLDEIGIAKIDLGYQLSQYIDRNGNAFRYAGELVPVSHDDVDRKIYDVFLVTTAAAAALVTK